MLPAVTLVAASPSPANPGRRRATRPAGAPAGQVRRSALRVRAARRRWSLTGYGDGVDHDAREWMDRGLYDPDAPEAPDRLATLRFLSARGATDDDLASAVAEQGTRFDGQEHGTGGGLPGLAGELLQRR